MRRVFGIFILSLFLVRGAFAECVSVDRVAKCVTFDMTMMDYDSFSANEETGTWTAIAWGALRSGSGFYKIPLSGRVEKETETTANCFISSPFNINYTNMIEPGGSFAAACVDKFDNDLSLTGATKLPGDTCPDRFYTVPYDVSCGEGMVDVADVAHCDEDTSGDYCLIGEVPVIPCAAGITTLRTGTGVSIPLWAERGTEPSLCVKYNDMVCYANLEVGQAAGAINVNYGDAVYHTVD